MNVARLHVIYSLLLAHCFTLAPEDEKAIDKNWHCAIYGEEEIAWPVFSIEDIEQYFPGARQMPFTELRKLTSTLPSEHPLKQLAALPARAPRPIKICSMPSQLEKLIAAQELSVLFDLRGVPGFFTESVAPGPGTNRVRLEMIADFGPWRINLPANLTSGLLVPYYNGGQYVLGIRVHRSVRDRHPFVLSSKGLPGGAGAIACRE